MDVEALEDVFVPCVRDAELVRMRLDPGERDVS